MDKIKVSGKKREFKPGNMLYPLPASLISVIDKDGNTNLITVAWNGTCCSTPPMLYISVTKERFSHHMLMETKEFVLNLTTEDMCSMVDMAGVKSGANVDKWKMTGFTPIPALKVKAPVVKESPLSLECKVTQVLELGSHDMFIAEIVAVDADEAFFDENDKFDLNRAGLVTYCHGQYRTLGETLGGFGHSVKKK